jgi:hypothetical protein
MFCILTMLSIFRVKNTVMKSKLCGFFLIALCIFSSCSNGDYLASPTSNANNSINPLNQLKAEDFNWKGTDPVSLDINGTRWVATWAAWGLDSNGDYIMATGGGKTLFMSISDSWPNNLYTLANLNLKRWAYWIDSTNNTYQLYFSDLGNSGQLFMNRNDSAVIKGLFHFKGVAKYENKVINITNGYFNIQKYP